MRKNIAIFFIILCLLFNVTFAAPPKTTPVQPKLLTVQEIAKKNISVVLINVYDKNKMLIGTGSGFIISADGKIITNYHVIEGAVSADVVMSNNKKYPISGIINYNINQDIAVIKISAVKLPFITLGDSSKLELGENIVAIGSPLGLQNTVSTGIVSSFREGNRLKLKDIQITAPISPGSSGGVLFNMYGEAVGITYAGIIGGQNLNFAIPINEAKSYMDPKSLTTFKDMPRDKERNEFKKSLYEDIYVADLCESLIELGTSIQDLSDTLYIGYEEFHNYRTTKCLDNDFVNQINNVIDEFNKNRANINTAADLLKDKSESINSLRTILDAYKSAIVDYESSHDSVLKYIAYKNNNDFDDYLSYKSSGYKKASDTKLDAWKGYYTVISRAKNNILFSD